MELNRYITIVKRWLWLLILGLILGGAGGYLYSASQTPVYQSTTRFVVMRTAQSSGLDYYSYIDSQQLISTYIQLLSTSSIAESASEQLGYKVRSGQASASRISDTQFVQLTVTDTNPEHAAEIANVLVSVLIDQNEELQAVRYVNAEQNLQAQADQVQKQITDLQSQLTSISSATVKDQITQVESQITDLQDQITELQTNISALTIPNPTAEEKAKLAEDQALLAQLQPVLSLYQEIYSNLIVTGQPVSNSEITNAQLSQLQTTLGLYQQIYVGLLSSLENVRLARAQNTPNVVQVEVATVPSTPFQPKPVQQGLLAAAVGLLLAGGIVFLIEYLDVTIKTPEDVEREMNLQALGLIGEMKINSSSNGKEELENLHTAIHPRSPISEAFRTLRTNLEFTGVDKPLKIILVTSAGPGEGKTTVASNLAFVLSQSNKKVILLDADLRKPTVHKKFGLSNRVGLSDVLRGKMTVPEAIIRWSNNGSREMGILTSGSIPPNPAELLGSEKMGKILKELTTLADYVVIDTPPLLVADAQVLSSIVSGILLVVKPGKTHIESARTAVEQLKRANTRILGVVLNRIPKNRSYFYGGYRHYAPYYYERKNQYSAYGSEEKTE
ncbi:MAG: polysaccharide biosynthesis tyrosine autokinase [Anaerolineales bacterium]